MTAIDEKANEVAKLLESELYGNVKGCVIGQEGDQGKITLKIYRSKEKKLRQKVSNLLK